MLILNRKPGALSGYFGRRQLPKASFKFLLDIVLGES
jgi:hypothetical protein